MDSIPERGPIAEVSLPRVLLDLHERRASGALTLTRQRVTKRVWLREGCPVFADSSRKSESLASRLLETGRISGEQHAALLAKLERGGGKEEAAILELGLLAPRELLAAVQDQVRRRLLECFAWSEGEFAFDADDAPPGGAAVMRLDPVGLVLEGLEAHWSAERLLAPLAAKLARYPVATERLKRMAAHLAGAEGSEALLASLDGRCRLDEVIQEGGGGLALVWILDAAGALDYRDEPSSSEAGGAAEQTAPAPGAPAVEIVIERAAGAHADAAPAPEGPGASAAGAKRSGAESREASGGPEALRREILEKHGRLAELDHYELLGVARDAQSNALKRAYFGAAKRFHPDTLARLGLEDVREAASALFAAMAKAYEVLSDAERRREYDAGLGSADEAAAARLIQAETLYRKGEIMLRAGKFAAAVEFLAPAVEIWPDDATYQGTLGWALLKKRPADPKAARPHLERAVELEPGDATALARLAAVLRELGETEAARDALGRARRIDPTVA